MLALGVPDAAARGAAGAGAPTCSTTTRRCCVGRPDGLHRRGAGPAGPGRPGEYADALPPTGGRGRAGRPLQHDDLHDAQRLRRSDGRHRFFDWGDASVGAPVPQPAGRAARGPAGAGRAGRGRRFCVRLRDAYLEPWRAYGSPAELRRNSATSRCASARCPGRSPGGASSAASTRAERTEWQDAVAGVDRRVPRTGHPPAPAPRRPVVRETERVAGTRRPLR